MKTSIQNRTIYCEDNLDIKTLRDAVLRFNTLDKDTSHFVNSNDICTPLMCVVEMVDRIPKVFWKNKNIKVLDPCCGNGNFHAYISTKTSLKNLYFNDINKKRLENVREYFGSGVNISSFDFLEWTPSEQFDLVIANPPFALFSNGKRASKNHNMSRDFVLKAIEAVKEGGYLCFILPDNWMSYADRNLVAKTLSKYQFVYLNIHGAKKYFSKVGSSFTYFVVQKTPNKKGFRVDNFYKLKDSKRVRIPPQTPFIPLYCSNETMGILNKVVFSKTPKYKVETTSFLHKYTKKHYLSATKTNTHIHPVRHTPTQLIYSNKKHKYQLGWKVFIPLTNQYKPFIEKDTGMTQSIAFIRCKTYKEAQAILKEVQGDVFCFINNITRYGNFNNIRVLQNLSPPQHFSLNTEEQECIKQFISVY